MPPPISKLPDAQVFFGVVIHIRFNLLIAYYTMHLPTYKHIKQVI